MGVNLLVKRRYRDFHRTLSSRGVVDDGGNERRRRRTLIAVF